MKSEPKVEIFVYYPIEAVKSCFAESLGQYLSENVWGYMGYEVEEDIRVMNQYALSSDEPINVVRYQFGDFYAAEERKDEIGELITENFNRWLAINSYAEESIFA